VAECQFELGQRDVQGHFDAGGVDVEQDQGRRLEMSVREWSTQQGQQDSGAGSNRTVIEIHSGNFLSAASKATARTMRRDRVQVC
jgi:hypothetical protein